jgi:hypothetical protein
MDDVGAAAAIAAAPVVVIAGVLLGLFFATGREAWGRSNDVGSVVFALLLVPVAVAANAGGAWTAVTAAGLAAMAVAAVASALTAAGRLTVAQLTVWQGGAFAALFVWVAGVSAERLPDALGWLGIAAAALAVTATAAIVGLVRRLGFAAVQTLERAPPVATVATLGAFLALPVWLVWLGLELLER